MKNIYRHLIGLFLLLFAFSVNSEDYLTTHIVEISPGIGYYNFDDERNLDGSVMGTIGLGLHLSRSWAVLLQYASFDTKRNASGISQVVDMRKYHVDVHRFFDTEKSLRPYLVIGYGEMDLISEGEEIHENMFNAGAGLYYKITPSWSVRTDVRIFTDRKATSKIMR